MKQNIKRPCGFMYFLPKCEKELTSQALIFERLHSLFAGHSRHLSHSRTGSDDRRLWNEIIHCTHVQRSNAHNRPITVLQTEGGRIVSGSQDFTMKVNHNLYRFTFFPPKITVMILNKRYPKCLFFAIYMKKK